MIYKAKTGHRGKKHSHSYFKNLIEILENQVFKSLAQILRNFHLNSN